MACIEQAFSGEATPGCPGLSLASVGSKGEQKDSAKFPPTTFGDSLSAAILGLDTAGRLGEEDVVAWWRARGAVSPIALWRGLLYAIDVGTWPAVPKPMPPIGSGRVRPLIIGNLWDPQTAYESAQEMATMFQQGSLVTWQGYGHCLSPPPNAAEVRQSFEESVKRGEPEYTDAVGQVLCSDLVWKYFVKGELPRAGHVCTGGGPIDLSGKRAEQLQAVTRKGGRTTQ
uniref:Peptidase S33 tripeptidyl aminopeptidase-like C-terminal domain-containing protein n=1 Tax=Zooxanthella nutricula TaxID=1333877 RepID=A0A7S2QFS6_9DINO